MLEIEHSHLCDPEQILEVEHGDMLLYNIYICILEKMLEIEHFQLWHSNSKILKLKKSG